ncbi:carboxypeptidase S [Suillus plorans]|uniref:Carboxypeptidase S n=1 Tax=Suillus plorans TaxID=116603 RepID=A0A9P7ABL3_9AGAM|nr:carboxypeptidase S [Suillus plorans]KAG1786028.1 carboxypeptidase S [Suillus plorans]
MGQTTQTEREPFSDEKAPSTVQNIHWTANEDPEFVRHATQNYKRRRSALRLKILHFACFLGLVLLSHHFWPYLTTSAFPSHESQRLLVIDDDMCPQVSAITPSSHTTLIDTLDEEYGTKEFKLKAYESLGGAVRIPTVCYDDLGTPEEDPRWEVFDDFHTYIEQRFPKVHATLQRTKVATYALVYHWQGTDTSLKPLLLAAHMDVVPTLAATEANWINPPFSGYYDGEWIWGRGSCDDKPGVIGIMTAIEALLEQGFKPTRTVILAFGIDEERGGQTGAAAIGKYLVNTYGEDSISMIVDEGGGFSDLSGTIFATPAVAEKGYLDVRVDVLTPGGHSSRPPRHTGIGILASVVTGLEANPHVPKLARDRTYYQGLQCRAKYDDGFPSEMRELVIESQTSDEKLHELETKLDDFDPAYSASAGTTQAIDIIYGGVKINALPEAVYAITNHRIADHSSVSELQDRFASIVAPVAAKHNMSLNAFGKEIGLEASTTWGLVKVSDAFGSALEPAPVTPTTGSGPYELLSGTILSTLKTNLRTDDFPEFSVVSPGLSLGNTDTRHYWSLTRHIFRYGHRGTTDGYNGAHTINEAIRAEGFLEQIRFFTRLILNADETHLLD